MNSVVKGMESVGTSGVAQRRTGTGRQQTRAQDAEKEWGCMPVAAAAIGQVFSPGHLAAPRLGWRHPMRGLV